MSHLVPWLIARVSSFLTRVGSTCLLAVCKPCESWQLPPSLHLPVSGNCHSCPEMEALICGLEFESYCQSLKPLNFCHLSPCLPPPCNTSEAVGTLFSCPRGRALCEHLSCLVACGLDQRFRLVWELAPQRQLLLQEILSVKLRLKGEGVGAQISQGDLPQSTSPLPGDTVVS